MIKVKKVLGILAFMALLTVPSAYAAEENTAANVNESEETLTTTTAEQMSTTQTTTSLETTSEKTTDTTTTAVEVGEAIKNGIEEQTGIKAVEASETVNQNVVEIRKALASGQYAITPEELANYTDEQLDEALQLFTRINQDFYGMDLGAYVRLLTALYQDKTIAVSSALAALSFDATGLSLSELKNQVDALENYLQTVYPANSSFISIRQLSHDELLAILNFITPLQEKMLAEEGRFFPGIIAWIARYASEGIPQARNELVKPVTTNATTETTTATNETTTESSVTKKEDNKKEQTGILPKMGDNPMFYVSVIGILVIISVTFIFYRRKKK
ncbi:LPXTG cell wall anchor domain-containing protein [Enterococcus montenegrensis]|uniref:LPXTG cell wall anchor domain-containing protein n=1 Tax=Enterococcus montenegrensis TaxID=3031993 RepID=UPI00249DDE90|nr:LPXTG cell wall anchor domain-containing protein [Enterococcus montenegrensis]WHA09726.1 LPXTG cell wall anchor domain-containing protein [Enterococcus montenegrensis]